MKTAKRIITALLLTICFTLFFAAAVQAKTYRVKQEKHYLFDGKDWIPERTIDYKYDGKGRKTKITEKYRQYDVDEEGNTTFIDHTSEETMRYKGNYMIQRVEKEDGKETFKYKVTLGKKNKVKNTITYMNGKLLETRTMKYNKKGLLSSVTAVPGSGKKTKTVYTYTYDTKGRVKKVVGKKKKKTVSTEKYKYSKNKETSTETGVDGDGIKYTNKSVYVYYPSGKVKKETFSSSSSEYGKNSTTFCYDKKGRTTKTVDKYGNIIVTTTYKDGNPVKQVNKTKGGKVNHTSKYTYNTSRKGITERIEKIDGDKYAKIEYSY